MSFVEKTGFILAADLPECLYPELISMKNYEASANQRVALATSAWILDMSGGRDVSMIVFFGLFLNQKPVYMAGLSALSPLRQRPCNILVVTGV